MVCAAPASSAAITAASLTLAPATPAEPVEQLLDDVSATHETSITAINSAETDDEVRDALVAWRKELIAASDELAELRRWTDAEGNALVCGVRWE